jgi:hypothetical protein
MIMTIKDFYNQIYAEKANWSELDSFVEGSASTSSTAADRFLNDVQSNSAVADWRLWLWVVAFMSWFLNGLFELFKKETEELANRKYAGSQAYYVDRMLAYQDGDNVIYSNGNPTYSVIDESKRIISFVSVPRSGGGAVAVKVAKEGPTPLTSEEYNRTRAYLTEITPPGIISNLISAVADRVRYDIELFFNPLYDYTTVQAAVKAAIVSYFENLPFNGEITRNAFIDAIQAVDGVMDVYINAFEHATGVGDYVEVTRAVQSYAGYVEIQDSESNVTMTADEL